MDEFITEKEQGAELNRARALAISVYQRGEKILLEGQDSPFFYVILSGRVRISTSGKKLRVLGEQDIFGLESLVLRMQSCYTAEAFQKCRVAKYGADTLEFLIHESPRMVRSLLMSTLHQLSQTARLVDADSEHLQIEERRMRFLRDGETLCDGGQVETDFYRLVSTRGGLRVTIGEKEVARIDRPGEFFGGVAGLAGLYNPPHQACIASIGESVVETYSLEDLDALIRDYPEVGGRIMRSLMKRLAEAECRPAGIKQKNPDE